MTALLAGVVLQVVPSPGATPDIDKVCADLCARADSVYEAPKIKGDRGAVLCRCRARPGDPGDRYLDAGGDL